jgi:chorismate--pyruvate lyase
LEKIMSKQDIKPIWKNPRCFSKGELESHIAEWLLFSGSFTQKIKKSYRSMPLTITTLNEQLERSKQSSYEYPLFKCRYMFVREIYIFLGEFKLMYARSVMPKTASTLYKSNFRNLGKKPLGTMLFNKNKFDRSPFEIAKIRPDTREYFLAGGVKHQVPFIWARRSVFSVNGDAFLLLAEYFSPFFKG